MYGCWAEACELACSIVGVPDDPAVELDPSRGLRGHHAEAQEDLACLVVEDDHHEEGERGHREVRERDHARAQRHVDPLEQKPDTGPKKDSRARDGPEALRRPLQEKPCCCG